MLGSVPHLLGSIWRLNDQGSLGAVFEAWYSSEDNEMILDWFIVRLDLSESTTEDNRYHKMISK